jgi:hypothetical protein
MGGEIEMDLISLPKGNDVGKNLLVVQSSSHLSLPIDAKVQYSFKF